MTGGKDVEWLTKLRNNIIAMGRFHADWNLEEQRPCVIVRREGMRDGTWIVEGNGADVGEEDNIANAVGSLVSMLKNDVLQMLIPNRPTQRFFALHDEDDFPLCPFQDRRQFGFGAHFSCWFA